MTATWTSFTPSHRPLAGATLLVCTLSVLTVGSAGCNLFDAHVREFDLLRGLAADAAGRLEDGSVGQAQISGQAVNPGIVLEAAIVYRASARYEGLAGQFMVATQGKLGRQIPWADVLDIINNSATAEEMGRRIAERLIDAAQPQEKATSQPSPGGAGPGAAAPGLETHHRPLAGATRAETNHRPWRGAQGTGNGKQGTPL